MIIIGSLLLFFTGHHQIMMMIMNHHGQHVYSHSYFAYAFSPPSSQHPHNWSPFQNDTKLRRMKSPFVELSTLNTHHHDEGSSASASLWSTSGTSTNDGAVFAVPHQQPLIPLLLTRSLPQLVGQILEQPTADAFGHTSANPIVAMHRMKRIMAYRLRKKLVSTIKMSPMSGGTGRVAATRSDDESSFNATIHRGQSMMFGAALVVLATGEIDWVGSIAAAAAGVADTTALMVPEMPTMSIDQQLIGGEAIAEFMADPSIEAEMLNDMAHMAMDFSVFLTPPKSGVYRFLSVIGRLFTILADYLPDHSIHSEELLIQLFLLTLSVKDLLPLFWGEEDAAADI